MINLSPPELREQIKYGRLNVLVLKYLVGFAIVTLVVASIVMVGLAITGNQINDLQAKLEQSTEQYKQYEGTLEEAEALSGEIDTIKSLLDREFKFSEVLSKISALIPAGATLDSITLSNEEDTLQLSTSLASQELATVFQKNMAESGLFSVADIQSVGTGSTSSYKAVFIVKFSPEESPVPESPVVEEASQ